MDKNSRRTEKKIVEEMKKSLFLIGLRQFVELKIQSREWENNPTWKRLLRNIRKGSSEFYRNGLTLTYTTRIVDVPRYGSSGHPQEISLGFYDPIPMEKVLFNN